MKIFLLTMFILLISTPVFAASSVEITGERAKPSYWLTEDGDQVLMNRTQLRQFNAQIRAKDTHATNLFHYPTQMPSAAVNKLLRDTSTENTYEVNSIVKVQYAVTINRADMRLLPKPWSGDKYDDFQATAIDPAQPVAVLLESDDKQFVFCQSRDYFGWIDRNSLAFTDRMTWESYIAPRDFLVVVDNKKRIKVKGKDILFQMGAVIPLIPNETDLHGSPEQEWKNFVENEYTTAMIPIKIPAFPSIAANKNENAGWLARLPSSVDGRLQEIYVSIADDKSVNKGWLPCTQNNIIRQAFKFLGDEYGWGGLNESVDCSAFVQDIYRSMGVFIPRDANRQEACLPIISVFNDVGTSMRYDIVRRAPVGSLLFKPGHVMLYLGTDKKGTPLIIHAMSSYFENGEKIFKRKVIVGDLTYKNGAGVMTIDGLTGIGGIIRH